MNFRSLRPIPVALSLLAFAVTAAVALTIPPNAFFTPRLLTTQQVSYFRLTVNYNDANIGAGVQFGMLPKNAFIDDVKCEVVTVFNAATTNVFTLGTTTTATEIVNAGDINEAATGVTAVTRGQGRSLTAAADTALYAKYTQTGTAATTGQVVCVIKFISDNDL